MIHNLLKHQKVILASASPRRKQIFELLGIKALYMASDVHEPQTEEKAYVQAKRHVMNKAEAIANSVSASNIIVAADTVVSIDGVLLGKPKDADEARAFLNRLSGRDHYVYTAVCICHQNRKVCSYERSKVSFCELASEDIETYLLTREPFDKAGAYGIQGFGSQFVKSISGCYFNVMGFPVHLFYNMLKQILKEQK